MCNLAATLSVANQFAHYACALSVCSMLRIASLECQPTGRAGSSLSARLTSPGAQPRPQHSRMHGPPQKEFFRCVSRHLLFTLLLLNLLAKGKVNACWQQKSALLCNSSSPLLYSGASHSRLGWVNCRSTKSGMKPLRQPSDASDSARKLQ